MAFGWFQALRALVALGITTLSGVILGISTWLELYSPSPFDPYNDVDNPVWPFTNLPWNIAVSGITISVMVTIIIGDFVRRKIISTTFVVELFWLAALCAVWVINTVVTVHTAHLYDNYCQEADISLSISDVCLYMYPHFKTTRTLDIVTTAAIFAFTVAMLIASSVECIRRSSRSSHTSPGGDLENVSVTAKSQS